MDMVREISEKIVESEDEATEDSEDGEAEVVALARRCLEIGNGSDAASDGGSSGTPSYK